MSYEKTVLITVSNPIMRDNYIKRIYTNLTKEPSIEFVVVKDQVNRVRIFRKVSTGVKTLIRTYLVVVVPIVLDLSLLYTVSGIVDFHLDETIKELQSRITKLKSLQGQRTMKGTDNVKTFEQLVRCLCTTDGEYGAS